MAAPVAIGGGGGAGRLLPRVLNSLSGCAELFAPTSSAPFHWYMCGPTVYDRSHLGHARTYVSFDIIRRVLEAQFAMPSTLAMNITDIDDKIIARARQLGEFPADLAARCEQEFTRSMQSLNVRDPDIVLRVTDHLDEIQDFIGRLIEKGFAYRSGDGSVNFDVRRFHESDQHRYGALMSSPFIPPLNESADFALWKSRTGEADHSFDSPWGPGRPGWHIECSAMASSLFGDTLHVHSGGRDLMFPHHTNEIAQCDACHGTSKVRPWTSHFWHSGHITINDKKMGKSLHNFVTIDSFLQEFSAHQFRMFCMLHRYRSNVNYSANRMRDAMHVLSQFDSFHREIRTYIDRYRVKRWKWMSADTEFRERWLGLRQQVLIALADDFNTPLVIALLLSIIRATLAYVQSTSMPQATLLASVGRYINDQMAMFGFETSVEIKQPQDDRFLLSADLLTDFRSSVRDVAIALPADSPVRSSLFSLCDQVRSDGQRLLHIDIRDRKLATPVHS